MFKLSFEPPKPKIAEEVVNLFKKKRRSDAKRKGEVVRWSKKERLLVVLIFVGTILLSFYFWYQGTGNLPQVNFNFPNPFSYFDFSETIILEK